jgi:hypothetical protein
VTPSRNLQAEVSITATSLLNAWVSSPQSIVFAFKNPNAGIQALTEGFTSASAVSIRTASMGIIEVTGPQVEDWVKEFVAQQTAN